MSINDIEWTERQAPASEEMIAAVEKALGVRFPADYRSVIPAIHGAEPSRSSFSYRNRFIGDVGTSFSVALSFDPDSDDYVLRKVRRLDDGLLPQGVVPFGMDGGGDLMAFDFRRDPKHPPVVYVAIGEADDEGGDGHVYPLAASFTEFLELLRDS